MNDHIPPEEVPDDDDYDMPVEDVQFFVEMMTGWKDFLVPPPLGPIDLDRFRWPLEQIEELASKLAAQANDVPPREYKESCSFWHRYAVEAIYYLDARRHGSLAAIQAEPKAAEKIAAHGYDHEPVINPNIPLVEALERITGQKRAPRAREYFMRYLAEEVLEDAIYWQTARAEFGWSDTARPCNLAHAQQAAARWIDALEARGYIDQWRVFLLQKGFEKKQREWVTNARRSAAKKKKVDRRKKDA